MGLPEIAFAGRSNVGKSSLINTLLNRKRLVKTSSTPGRTQLINFFEINESFVFVDLPGYGYAKVPKSVQKTWGSMVENYLSTRETLKGTILIIDIRRTPDEKEYDLIHWLNYHSIPITIVLTKVDKLSKSNQAKRRAAISKVLGIQETDLLLFSAKTRQGKEFVWEAVNKMMEIY